MSKKNILIIAILLSVRVCTFGAYQPEDGFYLRISDHEAAQKFQSQDGKKFSLGEKQTLKIQESEIISSNNRNSQYYLSLKIPYNENARFSSYVLIVEGAAYTQTGSGSSNNEILTLFFKISQEQNAKQVSMYLNTPINYRRHPQHNLLISFTPTKEKFNIGEEVTVNLRITNLGNNTIKFVKGGRNRAARDNQYIFSAYLRQKQVKDIGINGHMGGLSVTRILIPGDVFEDKVSLSKWFSFDEAGTYLIHGSYYLDFQEPDTTSRRTIWEDYVSADFIVKIEDKL